jgi:hypothetical protein
MTDKEDDQRLHPSTQKGNASAFAGWYSPRDLREEEDRIRALPQTDNAVINRWRRNRLWQIEQRLRELFSRRT